MNKRTVGNDYENLAADYIKQSGMEIICRNYRVRSGEIDLIARDGKYLVFIEVKYRADARKGTPFEAVNARKQQTIIRTAQYFLLKRGYAADTPCRFDVIGIMGDEVTHLKNAFWM